MSRFAIIALSFVFGLLASPDVADAGKAKFSRTKPHVNVAAIGSFGPGEAAVASLRLFAPSMNENGAPACSFEGIAVLSTNLPGRNASGRIPTVDDLVEVFTVDVMLDNPKQLLRIPFNVEPMPDMRVSYLFEVLSENGESMDQCGLQGMIEIFDLMTGTSTPTQGAVFNNYRPQFYLQTTDVTGDNAAAGQ